MLRSCLYEAAGVLLTRVAKWYTLKAWGMRVAKRSGLRKAKITASLSVADQIRHPQGRQVAGRNCTTTCQWIGHQPVCNTHCY